jgi:crotonobetaine/carnitine-CoA ligase
MHPFIEQSVGTLLEKQAAIHSDRVLIAFHDSEITFAEAEQSVNRIANGLVRLGVRKGDKVCVMLPNCPEFVYTWLALAKIGAVEVPINTAHRGQVLQYIINHSEAQAVVVDGQFISQLSEIAPDLQAVRTLIVHSSDSSTMADSTTLRERVVPFADLSQNSSAPPRADVGPTALLAIFYTGGTTGPSKGVMISHNFAIWSSRGTPCFDEVGGTDIYYCCLPLFHAVQLRVVLGPMLAGSRVALTERFSVRGFWSDIRRYRATTFMFVGAMLPLLWAQPPRPNDRDHTVKFATGNPVPPDLHRPFEERFGFPLLQSYAMTEAMPITRNPLGASKVGSSGTPIPGGYELKVVDENDVEVPRGAVGEFVVRSREPFTLMDGYYKMPEATLRAFRNLWFHTGDHGFLDDANYLFFVGREKDMIRRSGENISAVEIEQIVNSHPAVLESAAVAITSPIHGEEVKLVVVLKEDCQLSPERLVDYCRERMAYFMVPRYVEFVSSLPKTAIFRIEKYRLREAGITPATWDREKAGYKLTR